MVGNMKEEQSILKIEEKKTLKKDSSVAVVNKKQPRKQQHERKPLSVTKAHRKC